MRTNLLYYLLVYYYNTVATTTTKLNLVNANHKILLIETTTKCLIVRSMWCWNTELRSHH